MNSDMHLGFLVNSLKYNSLVADGGQYIKNFPAINAVRSTMMKNYRQQLRKYTIIGYSTFCILLSGHSFSFAATHKKGIISHLIVGVLLLGFAFAIFQRYRWALRLAAAICLLVAIFLPAGLFNPFTAGDYMAAGKEPPSVVQTLLWLIPLEALLLAVVFLIDPRKKRTYHEQS